MFDEATGQHAIDILHEAIAAHGLPATVMSDRGSQFYANAQEAKKKGASEFEKELVRLGIQHKLAGVNHPQTNDGKLERFHGEMEKKLWRFHSVRDFYHWYNNIRGHMSLDMDTPAEAYAAKMPPEGIVTDAQTGEQYYSSGNKNVRRIKDGGSKEEEDRK